MKKIIFTAIILLVILFAFVALLFCSIDSESNYIDKNKIIQTYTNNKDIFNRLSDYALENSENISIEKNDMANAKIDNSKIKQDCWYLAKKMKYRYIVEDDDAIEFIKQSDIEWGQGILYLKNGDKVFKLPYMKDLEHIEGNWYYFEVQQ